jgi:hypothetical protein
MVYVYNTPQHFVNFNSKNSALDVAEHLMYCYLSANAVVVTSRINIITTGHTAIK